MRIAGIVRDSIVDGVGVRDVVFFQGCSKHCDGCHNPQTWDYDGGTVYLAYQIVDELESSSNNITISGGEPLDQFDALVRLLKLIKVRTNKTVWLYTGEVVDMSKPLWKYLAKFVDVVVDGRYVCGLRDANLPFRGSTNQRLIDMKKSLEAQTIVKWEE